MDHKLCMRQIPENKNKNSKLFADFQKGYASSRSEVLCNIISEFGIIMKLLRLMKCA